MENLIIDTDLGFDCDDSGALAIANKLHNEGKIKLLAVTHSVNKKIGGDGIKLINDYYGNGDIPIGVAETYAMNVDNFGKEYIAKFRVADNFPGWQEEPTFYKILNALDLIKYKDLKYGSATEVIRETLEKSEDKSVTVVCIGQAGNVAAALTEFKELFYKKVKRVAVMCGNFNDYDKEYLMGGVYWKGEFNVILDVRSMQKLFESTDLPVYVLDFNQGCDVLSGEGLRDETDNPVRTAYVIHGNGRTLNLPSWDPMTVMFAAGLFSEDFSLSEKGTVSVDDNGKTTFKAGSGEHRLIYRKSTQTEFADILNKML